MGSTRSSPRSQVGLGLCKFRGPTRSVLSHTQYTPRHIPLDVLRRLGVGVARRLGDRARGGLRPFGKMVVDDLEEFEAAGEARAASRRVAFDVDREATRAPGGGFRREDAGHPGPAACARARGVERISSDRIAVAPNRAGAACRAERRQARGMVNVAIDVVKAVADGGGARAFCKVGGRRPALSATQTVRSRGASPRCFDPLHSEASSNSRRCSLPAGRWRHCPGARDFVRRLMVKTGFAPDHQPDELDAIRFRIGSFGARRRRMGRRSTCERSAADPTLSTEQRF
jgi:hypothetical protein